MRGTRKLLAACAAVGIALVAALAPSHAMAAPAKSSNIGGNDYAARPGTTTSYIYETPSGNLVRAEQVYPEFVIEEYTPDGRLLSSKVIDQSTYLPPGASTPYEMGWGGLFFGEQNNYLVTGKSNYEEDDSAVVVRVTKYDKDWNYVDHLNISDIDTTQPFAGGSCRMVESDGKLYIRTARGMYAASDGVIHQANMTLVIDEASMTLLNGPVVFGYVSHSNNQFLAELNGDVYALDHGDAYPRAFEINKLGGGSTNIMEFSGSIGNNFTGSSVGGFESSATEGTLLAVGSTMNQDKFGDGVGYGDLAQNIWISATSADLSSTKLQVLKLYEDDDNRFAGTPHLVKVNDDLFMVLWNNRYWDAERNTEQLSGYFSLVMINGKGQRVTDTYTQEGSLSDCQPIVVGDRVVWYVTGEKDPENPWSVHETMPTFYSVEITSGGTTSFGPGTGFEVSGVEGPYGETASYVYTGSEIEPVPTVTYEGKTLREGYDYELTYRDNVDVGLATLVVSGLGEYGDMTEEISYMITPASISDVAASCADATISDGAAEPVPVLTFNGKRLALGTDFVIESYENNTAVGTGTVTVRGKGNFIGTMAVRFNVVAAPSVAGFPDVRPDDWYAGRLGYALEHGLISGYDDGTFGPYDPVSRAQVATILWRMAGRPEVDAPHFPDCDYSEGSYYAKAVSWARAERVISGRDDGTFAPNVSVTREELATMLRNYARRVAGMDTATDGSKLAALGDAGTVSAFARDAMGWAVDEGIISGDLSTGSPLARPQGTAQRCELAKMVSVFHADVLGLGEYDPNA